MIEFTVTKTLDGRFTLVVVHNGKTDVFYYKFKQSLLLTIEKFINTDQRQ